MKKARFVEVGDWRTLEWVWWGEAQAVFVRPAGAQVKVRYGNGRWCGRDSQQQTLDGSRARTLKVGPALFILCGARMQIAVPRSTEVTYQVSRAFPRLPAGGAEAR
jgi:hypothetical protein